MTTPTYPGRLVSVGFVISRLATIAASAAVVTANAAHAALTSRDFLIASPCPTGKVFFPHALSPLDYVANYTTVLFGLASVFFASDRPYSDFFSSLSKILTSA
jgi:hypothetical protein